LTSGKMKKKNPWLLQIPEIDVQYFSSAHYLRPKHEEGLVSVEGTRQTKGTEESHQQ
jgi:hypothetical protein